MSRDCEFFCSRVIGMQPCQYWLFIEVDSLCSTVTFSEEQVSRILEELQVCCPQDDWQLLLYLSDLQEQIQTSGKCKPQLRLVKKKS